MTNDFQPVDENTERPDRDRAQRALDKTPSDVAHTAGVIAENKRLIAIVRQARKENHFVDKFRAIIVGQGGSA